MFTIRKGFTLIELLVVIAIIAILAAILFPVFAQAREKARQASCLSNCKQIGTALQLYVDDWDETIPGGVIYNIADVSGIVTSSDFPMYSFQEVDYWGNYGQLNWATWMDALFPYVKNINIYKCPSGKKNIAGYGANPWLWGGYTKVCSSAASPLCLGEISNSSQFIFIGDGFQTDTAIHGTIEPLIYNVFPTQCARHLDGANFAFADGHAKYHKRTSEICKSWNGATITYWGDFNNYWKPN
ncbi:MAG: DUF1559 domain-containing protein [Abditibacteriota bacterium]|nr:DUF1559 domain-containing protein [Abditibacteriota bacterium]